MKEDVLYHLDLSTGTHDLPAMFGDVKVRSGASLPGTCPPSAASLVTGVVTPHRGPRRQGHGVIGV